jgi:hypothetical protein
MVKTKTWVIKLYREERELFVHLVKKNHIENQIGIRLLKNTFNIIKQVLCTVYSRKEKLSLSFQVDT